MLISQMEARERIFLFVMLFFGAVLLLIQLSLCFTVKSKVIRLSPVIILSAATVWSYGMSITTSDRDSVAYGLLAGFAGLMLSMCGVSWGIWGISKLVKRAKPR